MRILDARAVLSAHVYEEGLGERLERTLLHGKAAALAPTFCDDDGVLNISIQALAPQVEEREPQLVKDSRFAVPSIGNG